MANTKITASLLDPAQTSITSLGTLSALTISGDLTVDTSTLKVDSSNNRVGVGTASPQALFHAAATNTTVWPFTSAQSGTYSYTPYPHELVVDNDTTGNEGSFASVFFSAGADSDGSKIATARIGAVETGNYKADLVFGTRNTSFQERMRITAAGLVGIATSSPAYSLDVDSTIHIGNDGGTGYSHSRLIFDSNGSVRGAGTFFHNQANDVEWFAGNVYNLADSFSITRNATASHADATADVTNSLFTIRNDGKVGIGITSPGGLPLQTKVSSGDNKFRQTTASKDAFTLGLDNSTGDTIIGTHTTYPHTTFKDNGNVGIGISSPTQKLDVRGGSGAGTLTHAIFTGTSSRGLEIRTRSDTSGGQNSGTAEINSADSEGTGGDLALSSDGNVRMFIDGAGHIGFNTTSIQTFNNYTSYHFTPNGTTSTALLVDDSTGSSGRLQIFMAGSGYFGTRSNDELIFTTNDAARMRILANGVFIHGKSTDDVDTIGNIWSTGGQVYSSTTSSNNSYHYRDVTNTRYNFYVSGSGQVNARTNSIAIISDARLKENIRDYTVGLNDILKLKPRVFDWKEKEGEKDQVGFIAQEFEEVFPNWIGNFLHDDLDDAKSVSASEIIYPMVNAIKELKAEIDALKEKLNG